MSESDPSPSSRHKLAHRLGMKCFLLAECGLRHVGMRTLCRLGRCLGVVAWHMLPERRRIVERNLRIVLDSSLRGRKLDELVRENFKRTISNFLGSAKTATLTDAQLRQNISIAGHDEFARPVLEGRGLVCAVVHSGNWEALARIRVFYPEIKRYGSMYRQFDNPMMEEYVYKRRTESGTQMFSKEGGVKAPMKMLKEGGALGVLSDQFVWEGVYVPFFGKVTGTTPLPALLMKRTGAEMAAIFVSTKSPGRWAVDMGQKVDFAASDGSLAGDTLEVNRALEQRIMTSPLDVFWMHHRWKSIDKFAPRDEKTFQLLKTLDLKPYRILVAMPRALDEALLSLPLIRALKRARPDMQVNVICPSSQAGVWKTLQDVTHILPHDTLPQLKEALAADAFYSDGPLDMGVMLDGDIETLKALKPYRPIMFSGFDTHPGCRKYKFKFGVSPLMQGEPGHAVARFLMIGDRHGLDMKDAGLFPCRKDDPGGNAPVLIAPFSSLGPSSEWGDGQWSALVQALPAPPVMIAFEEDRERAAALAERLHVKLVIGHPETLLPAIDSAALVVTVDGDVPSLCSYRGTPSVTLFSSRLPDVHRPLGTFHRTLYRHECCSPCYLRECDRAEPCNRKIKIADVLTAMRELTAPDCPV